MANLIRAKGLVTFGNELDLPAGSLIKADNVNIDENNVIEIRRGMFGYGDPLPLDTDRVKQLLVYKDRIFRHFNNSLQYDNGSGTFTSFNGSYTEPESGRRMRFIESNGNFFFTTNEGVKKISATAASEFTSSAGYITNAGGVKALDFQLTANGVLGFLAVGKQAAYRVVWGTKDKNGNLISGYPGPRTLIENTSVNDINVELTIQVPEDVTTDYFVQIYRTATITPLSPGEDSAGDEMNLVDERPWDGSSPMVIIDETIDEFRDTGTPLYTNPISGSGILQGNERPPICKDMALFRECAFFANTKTVHRAKLNVLTAAGLNGYSISIGNSNIVRTYSFVNYASPTPDPSTLTAGGATIGIDTTIVSPALAIDILARKLVKYINLDTSAPIFANYSSTDTTLPGLIDLENDSLEDIKFYISCSDVSIKNKFNPELTVIASPTTTTIQTSLIYSDNEKSSNRVYFSKPGQPEAVPIANYLDIGPRDKIIHRILSLRDNLFILKEDGVYILTGNNPTDFGARLLDNSARIIAPDSAVILNNRIFCLANQGIIAISESGVQVVSRDIENLIKDVTKTSYPYKNLSFGVSYESDRSFVMWMPSSVNDTYATQAYRYNTFTNSWTRWLLPATCGIVNSGDDKLYIGSGNTEYVEVERKNLDRTDHADREFTIPMLAVDSIVDNFISISNVSGVEIGDAVYQKQYITRSFFNRLLKKLDLDNGLTDNNYYSILKMEAGDDLRLRLIDLDAKLSADATIGTYTPVVIQTTFSQMQSNLNSIITQLNSLLTGTVYKDYRESSGNVYYESTILSINSFQNKLEIITKLPFLYGEFDPLTIFKSIKTEVVYAPQHFGEPEGLKQITDVTMMFDQNNFYRAIISYKSDLSQNFEDIEYFGRGIGVWGLHNWGEIFFGGQGSDSPMRTYVPSEKQRCRYLTCRFKHGDARNKYRIVGISGEPRAISKKAYK